MEYPPVNQRLTMENHHVLWENSLFLWPFSNPPCIARYKVDILCAYKVGFRSPLYIPTMGDKAVFCARNMPLDLEDDFIRTLAFQFIPGWFPTRKRLNICGNAFYRPLVPFKEWPWMAIICHTIHFIETCLPNYFGPIFFCWGCIHGKALYRVKLALKKKNLCCIQGTL